MTAPIRKCKGIAPPVVCPECQKRLMADAGEWTVCPRCKEWVTAEREAVE